MPPLKTSASSPPSATTARDPLRRAVAEHVHGEPAGADPPAAASVSVRMSLLRPDSPRRPLCELSTSSTAVEVEAQPPGRVAHEVRLDVAAARTHHQALERREAHRGVHRAVVQDRGSAAPVAQVQGHHAQPFRGAAEQLGRTPGEVPVARAVGAVSADVVLVVPGLRDGVAMGHRRHRRVERGVEDRHVRDVGSCSRAASMPARLAGTCSGASSTTLTQGGEHPVVDDDRLGEPRAAVHHPVPDCGEAAALLGRQRRQQCRDHAAVRRIVGPDLLLVLATAQAPRSCPRCRPSRRARSSCAPRRRVDDGELDRRAAAVDDEDLLGVGRHRRLGLRRPVAERSSRGPRACPRGARRRTPRARRAAASHQAFRSAGAAAAVRLALLMRVHHQVVARRPVAHGHVERRGGGALLDEAADLEPVGVRAAVHQLVDRAGVAVEGEDHVDVVGEQLA